MLIHLLIKNYALIEQLELTPDPHLNIITGETGAGKSILLGAIGLLMGNRADTKVLYNPDQKCVIEGAYDVSGYVMEHVFEEEELDYAPTCLIRREIGVSGKSRAFVNDTPVNLESLRRITSQLMDVHSQHDTLLLGSNEYQLQIVDTFAQNDEALKKYRVDFQVYQKNRQLYERLKVEAIQLRKEFNYNQFLFEELEKANLQADEQEQLEQELVILENATEVRERLQMAYEYLNNSEQSVLDLLKGAIGSLNVIGKFAAQYDQLRERAQSSFIELRDLADEIGYEQENVEIDDERAQNIRQRLALLYQLQQKHQLKTIDELLALQADLEQKVNNVLNLDENILAAKNAAEKTFEKLSKSAEKLSASRQKALPAIEKAVTHHVADLGMPDASLTIQHQIIAPTEDGIDSVAVLFSANKGIKPQPLKNVASGGEFSRLMMAIKYILASKRKLPTIIFDEIDTGVSGEIAIRMGNMMRDIAQNHQVISITHLHQIAALGVTHYFVYKDNSSAKTVSRIKKLNFEERVVELSQMIGGKKPSESIVQNARELLQQQLASKADKVQIKLF